MAEDEARAAEKVRGKHIGFVKKLHKQVGDELGTYAEGGPPVFVRYYEEGPGLSKRIENMTDDELDEVTGIELHMKRHTPMPERSVLEAELPND